jgi:hypothetical protein
MQEFFDTSVATVILSEAKDLNDFGEMLRFAQHDGGSTLSKDFWAPT